jgi:protein transport protein SEC61 subunit gamma-like protein
MSDQISSILEAPVDFAKDGIKFAKRCQKPDSNELIKMITAVGIGFAVMGATGYIVKLIHMPLNHALVGGA